jgi:glyceraldehyde-3-phosphate dehydrogenase/erythrose-4-phosphate dehydrogenase
VALVESGRHDLVPIAINDLGSIEANGTYSVTTARKVPFHDVDDALECTTRGRHEDSTVRFPSRHSRLHTEALVSVDLNHSPASCTFAATQTAVGSVRVADVVGCYDNEWGFSCRMRDTAALFGGL